MPTHNNLYFDEHNNDSSEYSLKKILKGNRAFAESLQVTSATTPFTDAKDEIKKLKEQYKKEESLSRSTSASSLNSICLTYNKLDRFKDFFADQEDRSTKANTTSYLRPGATFVGSQQSGRSTYEVVVELKEVDLAKSELSGYLKIQGLTEDYPEIITFFKAEIVGPNYSFYTSHDSWGSSKKNDIQHWSRFSSWRSLNFDLDNDLQNNKIYKEALNQEYIYMRWKETFLVPDAKVTTIRGASFAGFYYICFNQLTGSITGLYFHKSSERFQQLELSHVPDSGKFPIYEYQ